MKKLIVIDSGNIKHKAIFAYSSRMKKELEKVIEEYNVDEEEAKKILNNKIRNYEIFMENPTRTYLRMIIGYLKKLEATFDDIVIIAEDFGSWRKEIDKNYKAQRKDFRESIEEANWWKQRYQEFNELIPSSRCERTSPVSIGSNSRFSARTHSLIA